MERAVNFTQYDILEITVERLLQVMNCASAIRHGLALPHIHSIEASLIGNMFCEKKCYYHVTK